VILRDEFCNKGLRKIRDFGWPYTSVLRTLSVITCRYDKVQTAINNQEKVQMTDSMLNFLGKPISTSSSSSSSSSSSFKKASSSRKLLR
jgi:hypothetical protein